ncbi:MAG: hypothetical protein NT031_19740, partial [Planctomycetota bacterium]|nr:hypothetical protein [Planctomycetota bacterium]
KWGKKAKKAIFDASESGYAAIVILIDRDGDSDAERIVPIREARDATWGTGVPCAVGQAVEAFDAWMIADGKAIKEAGGDAARQHPMPENLAGKDGSKHHPKAWAMDILGGKESLADKYAVIAAKARLDILAACCPKGFAPFAEDVKERIRPVVDGR